MMESAPSDRDAIQRLIEKYDRPGPRYTSYPTAVEFSDAIGARAYEERLREADELGDAPLSLYTHIPFCEERCLFCGCHVIITRKHERTLPYLDFLRREVELVAARLPRRRKFAQLHLGGGTPTYYAPAELRSLVDALLDHFEPLPGAEMAVEVDPRVTTPEHIDVLAERGFNRVSMGVQDLTPKVQERIHRVQSGDETRAIVDRARLRGYSGINVDLIYGLPLQTPETFERTVDSVIEMGVDRVACYSFAFVPWIRGHQTKLDESELPGRSVKLELFALVREKLLGAGYEAIGMDHFARPADELARARREGRLRRNFQGYAVIPGDDVLGFGISAIGDVRGSMVQNEKKLSGYQRAIDAGRLPVSRGVARSRDDAIRADVIHRLMCNFVIRVEDVERAWNLTFADYFREDLELLAPHAAEGLVEIGPQVIRATPIGELFVRNLAMCFDRYMREKHAKEAKPVFSRTV
jgi:oxygen-independent coproporphyrinogen-3 oxidase